jgi:hypothetical protein
MTVIKKREAPGVRGTCPDCGSLIEVEEGDITWYKDIDGGSSPYVRCGACHKQFDVEGWKGIYRLY